MVKALIGGEVDFTIVPTPTTPSTSVSVMGSLMRDSM